MKQNVGLTDRIIRVMIAIILGSIYFMDFVSGTTAIIVLVLAIIGMVTGIAGYCLLYALVGISSAADKDKP
jgi:F0F1-type ATP synthase assembly protein I